LLVILLIPGHADSGFSHPGSELPSVCQTLLVTDISDLVQREHPQVWGRTDVGLGKLASRHIS